MKKLSTIILVLFGTITILEAQFYAGVKAGVLSSDAKAGESISIINSGISSQTNFYYGATAEYFINPTLSLKSELLITKRGFNVNQATNVEVLGVNVPLGAKLALDIKYIEIPVLLQYNHNIGNIDLFINGGPSIAYASSASLVAKATVIFDFNLYETDIDLNTNYIDRTDYNLNLGGGLAYNTASGRLTIETRYGQAMNSAISNTLVDTKLSNKALQFSAGYQMKF